MIRYITDDLEISSNDSDKEDLKRIILTITFFLESNLYLVSFEKMSMFLFWGRNIKII